MTQFEVQFRKYWPLASAGLLFCVGLCGRYDGVWFGVTGELDVVASPSVQLLVHTHTQRLQ